MKELEVTCCHAWEKKGSLPALLGGLLLRGLGLLMLALPLSGSSASALLAVLKFSSLAPRIGLTVGLVSASILGLSSITETTKGLLSLLLRQHNQIFVNLTSCYRLLNGLVNRGIPK